MFAVLAVTGCGTLAAATGGGPVRGGMAEREAMADASCTGRTSPGRFAPYARRPAWMAAAIATPSSEVPPLAAAARASSASLTALASEAADSSARLAPMPIDGVTECAASPTRATLPSSSANEAPSGASTHMLR